MLPLEGYPLEIALTTANSAAQAWYGYDQVGSLSMLDIHRPPYTDRFRVL